MAVFSYTARNAQGEGSRGTIRSATRPDALAALRARGLTPVTLEELGGGNAPSRARAPGAALFGGSVSLGEKAVFCRQLAISVGSGVSLREALESIASDEDHVVLRRVLGDIVRRLHDGSTFSEALAQHGGVFPPIFVSLIRSAEESGSLPETLERLASSRERSERLISKIRSITAYPIFVAVFFVIVCLVMTLFVLPKFEAVFKSYKAGLPTLTRVVFGLNRFVLNNLPVIALVVLGVCVSVSLWIRTAPGRRWLDRAKLRVPFFGACLRKYAVARFARNLAILLRGGVPVATGMEMAAATCDNSALEASLLAARNRILDGNSISGSLEQDPTFPRMLVRMVGVGESTGRLPEVLDRLADMYEQQVEASILVATAMFEPVIICFFGIVILVLVLAVYIPVFTVAQKVH